MERFQGFMSQDSRRGSGLRIEFAKQRMGEVSYNKFHRIHDFIRIKRFFW